jgi:hypothetical protein
MKSSFVKAFGMEWAGPILRTAVQAGLVILVGSGTDWYDGQVWKSASLAAGAAALAALQAKVRDE